MFRALIYVALLAGFQTAAHADVWRWTDAQGRVQYSDRWVPGSELVKVDRAPVSPQPVATSRATDQNKLAASNARIAEQQAEAANAQATKQDVAKVQQEQCEKAKERYDKAIHARRIFREKDGNREFVSDADADAYRAKARSDMQVACGSSAK